MIGHFPTPHPDELFYSICSRYGDRVKYPNKEAINSDLFGARGCAATIDLPSHLEYLTSNLPYKDEASCRRLKDKFTDNNTLLPLYSPFLPPERAALIREAMGSSNGANIHGKAGINPSKISLPNWLRFCPICVDEDRKHFGECYWHRQHQAPGVEVCSLHEVFLTNSNVSARNRVNSSVYISAESALLKAAVRPLSSLDTDHQVLLRIAQDAAWLLKQVNLLCASDELRNRYLVLLGGKGLLRKGDKISIKGLIREVRNTYSDTLLDLVQCQFDEKRVFNWPSLIINHTLHQKTDPPVRHLLLIQLLGITAQTFFCSSLDVVPPKVHNIISEDEGVKPFGGGPWPCLNTVCKHYGKLVIETCIIKAPRKNEKNPIGSFACACGFTYRRRGPDNTPEDLYRYDWVLYYGTIWETHMREMWNDLSISLRQVALKLNVNWNTAKAAAVRLNLKFPRKGPTNTVSYSPPVDARPTKPPVRTRLTNRFAINRKSFRKEWLSTRKQHPNALRKQLRKELALRAYGWLYKNDKKWLWSHLPPPYKRVGSARLVNWEDRDAQLSKRVYASALRLRNAPGRPGGITKQAIARDLDEKTSLMYKDALVKLPLTVQILETVVESRVGLAIRRVKWAADHFRQENIVPAYSTLGLRAGIDHSIWYIPEVRAAFENSLRLLEQEVVASWGGCKRFCVSGRWD
jgi:hypothetical protein